MKSWYLRFSIPHAIVNTRTSSRLTGGRRRPAVGTQALLDREARKEAGHRDELREGYQSRLHVNDDGRTVAVMDVLVPGIGGIIGGSQREERLEILDRSMAERGIDREH